MRMHLSWLAFLLAGLACTVPGMTRAQSYTYSIYVDSDANSGTGCAENGFSGAEVRLQVATSVGSLPAILAATQSVCSGGAFGPAAPLSGGAALGFDTGLSGADVIELAADEGLLRTGSSPMRLGASALSAAGSDQLYGNGSAVPVIGGRAVPVPLLGAPMLALLVLLLLVVGARRARRWRVVAMLISLAGTAWAANFVVDGQTQDWAGVAPLATDSAGDATSGEQAIDLLALFGAVENGRIFFRLDVANLQANPPGSDAVTATTREDTPVTLALTGSDAQGATLTFAIASAPSRGTLGALIPTGPTSATVEYTPDPDVNGSDSFTYTVANGQGVSAPATANVTITPVNDAPRFTAQDPPPVDENAGPQTTTVATAIAAGPATALDEATQALDFIVTANDNPALFAAPPTISPAGLLSYEPAANANGTATLSVVLHDDGGTLDGGVDTSAPQQITLTVNAVDNVPVMSAGGTLAYIENAPPAAVDPGVTVSDIDSATLAGATVRISAGYQNGADVLAFAGTPAISASFDAATGRLSLTGVDTLANYQAALRAVTYVNSSDDPDPATRTVAWQANDGTGNSAPVTSTITVTPVNDPATIVAGGTLAYVEDTPPTPVDVTVTVTDPDNAVLVGASVQIGTNYSSGEDVLAFAPAGGITGVFDAATGTLTLNGSAPLATYQAALRAVTYVNTSASPSKAARTVAWQVNDGSDPSNIATSTITVTGVDNAPVITAGGTLAYTESNPPAPIDPTLTVVDADSAVLAGAAVQVSANYQSGADVLGFAATATITGAWDAASATLTLSGTDSPAAYQAALRSVTFVNTSNDPSVAPRTIRFTASDGSATSAPATSTVTVTAVNDPPVLTGGAAITYTEDDAPTVVDGTLAVADPDSTTLAGATVQISANYVSGEDVLAFTPAGAISGSFLPATGVLTLSGVDTLANYAAVLRSVTYSNASQNPTSLARSVSFQVNDGVAGSNLVASAITVVPVNDAPVVTAGAAVSYTEGAPAVVADPALTVSDVDSPTLAGASVQVTGNFNAAQDVLAFTPVGAITGSYDGATGTLTLGGTDTPANYQAALRSVTYRNTSQNPSTGMRTLSWSAGDGTATSVVVTSAVAVISINSAPVFTAGPDLTVLEDAGARTVAAWASAIDDGDGGGQALTFEVTGNTNPALFSVAPAVSATGTLTYTPAPDANGSATITLVLHDDGGTANGGVDTSAPQTFTITLTPVNDAPSFVKGADISVLEDLGPQTIDPWASGISAGPANESGQSVSFTVTGNTNPALFAAAPSVSASGALSFTSAPNTTGSATITLVARDDGGTANGGVDASAPQTFTITVVLVNHAPTFVPGGNVSVNEDSGAYSAAWASAIDDGDAGVTQALDFIVSNDNNALFAVPPSITPAGTLSFTPAPDANGTAQVTVRLHDDGGTANGGVDTSAPHTFTITVNPVNDAPSFAKGADVSVLQDLGPQTINPWASAISAGPPNESGQSVSFSVTGNTNPALFATGPVVSANGALSFTSAPNSSGSATITLVARDDGGTANGGVDTSAPQTFTITILFVNQAPSFVPGGNVSVNEDSGPYSAPWATAIDDGNAGVTQALDFIVSNDNSALFAVQPSITSTGTLNFTPAPEASGSAQVTVRLHDDGGTANGGVDTSAPQTFTITVNPVNDPPIAAPHVLSTHSGISITIGAGDSERLKDGATDVDNPFANLRVSATFTNITPAGATVTLLDPVIGTYRYDPPPGYHGPASFDYAVCDDGIPTPPVQCGSATVSVDITGPDLWFVNASAPAGGSGRLSDPFNSLAALPVTRGTGDKVFVFAGDYASGHLLNDSEELVGEGASGAFDTLFGVVVPANGTLAARPSLGGTAPTIRGTVTMANASKVQGVAIASGSSTGLFASGKTGLRVSQTSVVSAAAAIDISSSSADASGVTLTSTTSSGGANGIRLASISGGAFNLGSGSLGGNTTTAFSLATGSTSVSYAGSITATGAARPVDISGVSGAATTVALSGTITAANGIRVANNTAGTITFSGASQALTTTTNTAVDLATNSGATVNFSGGGLVIKTTSGAGFKATGGGTVTVSGTGNSVASGSGVGVTVQNTSIGASGIRFQSVATDAAANGILLASSGSGPFLVDGGTSDPANTTRGRTTAAQGGGTLVLGAGGTINASSGAGVSITNAGGSVTLRNMVVQGGAAEGVRADGVAGLVLDNTRIAGHANFSGIAGTSVNGLTLQHVEVQGNGTSASAATSHNWGIRFGQFHTCGTGCADGLVGTALVANSLITNSAEYVFGIENANNSVLNLTLTNNQISDTGGAPAGAYGFSARAWNNANISISATGNLFRNTRSNAFSYLGDDSSGGGTINLSGNQFANNGVDAAIAHQGLGKTVTVTMDNNVTRQTLVAGSSVSLSAITGGVSNGGTVLRGSMSGNTVGNSTIASSGSEVGAGMGIEARGPGTVTLRANNNIVRSIGQDYALYVSANSDTTGSNRLNLTATGNTLNTNPSASAFGALAGFGLASGGNGGGDNTHVCAHLAGNVSYVGDSFYFGAEIVNLAAASDISLEGYGAGANNVGALSAFITTTATTVTPAPSVVIGAGTIKPAAGACPTAP